MWNRSSNSSSKCTQLSSSSVTALRRHSIASSGGQLRSHLHSVGTTVAGTSSLPSSSLPRAPVSSSTVFSRGDGSRRASSPAAPRSFLEVRSKGVKSRELQELLRRRSLAASTSFGASVTSSVSGPAGERASASFYNHSRRPSDLTVPPSALLRRRSSIRLVLEVNILFTWCKVTECGWRDESPAPGKGIERKTKWIGATRSGACYLYFTHLAHRATFFFPLSLPCTWSCVYLRVYVYVCFHATDLLWWFERERGRSFFCISKCIRSTCTTTVMLTEGPFTWL